jgi:DNA-binding NarL/FixJ family response regulator
MSRKTIRVLIVDDHAIVREGYRSLLAKHEGLQVVGEACDAASRHGLVEPISRIIDSRK